MASKIEALINKEIEGIKNIPTDNQITDVVDLIYDQVHSNNSKVIISGVGKAGLMGMKIAATLSSTGTPAVYLSPLDAQHGDLGVMQAHDVLFVISNSGGTREIVELVDIAKNCHPNIKIVTLTQASKSILIEKSDKSIVMGKAQEICPLGLTPTVSTTVMSVIGDFIVVLLMEKIQFSKEEYGKRHHSGYLGQKAREK